MLFYDGERYIRIAVILNVDPIDKIRTSAASAGCQDHRQRAT